MLPTTAKRETTGFLPLPKTAKIVEKAAVFALRFSLPFPLPPMQNKQIIVPKI
jgi:hypothetical protein